jgi:hypothetical protein
MFGVLGLYNFAKKLKTANVYYDKSVGAIFSAP